MPDLENSLFGVQIRMSTEMQFAALHGAYLIESLAIERIKQKIPVQHFLHGDFYA